MSYNNQGWLNTNNNEWLNTSIIISTAPVQFEITYGGNETFDIGVCQPKYQDESETFESVDELIDHIKEYMSSVEDFWCTASLITWKGHTQGSNASSTVLEYKYFKSINDSELKDFIMKLKVDEDEEEDEEEEEEEDEEKEKDEEENEEEDNDDNNE